MGFSFTQQEKERFSGIMVEFCEGNEHETCFDLCVSMKECSTETVRWLLENGSTCNEYTMYYAATGSLKVIKWLKDHGCPLYKHEIAAALDDRENLEWFVEQGARMTENIVGYYASDERLETINWLKDRGCPVPSDPEVLVDAAKRGQLQLVKWLRVNGCHWSSKAVAIAAEKGHFEVVMWLVQNDCPWNREAITCAKREHPEIVKWLQQYGCSPG